MRANDIHREREMHGPNGLAAGASNNLYKRQNSSNEPVASGELFETDLTDQVLKESRIEALRSLLLILVREMDSLKQMVVPDHSRIATDHVDLLTELDSFESSLIKDALIRSDGNQREAARRLSIKPTTLHAKIKRLGIHLERTISRVE